MIGGPIETFFAALATSIVSAKLAKKNKNIFWSWFDRRHLGYTEGGSIFIRPKDPIKPPLPKKAYAETSHL